ncbi:MAG: trehalose-6-phosphate synthase, partial [Thermodesulfatator sp.]
MTENMARLVAVSNRLPIKLVKKDDHWQVRPGAGGLVTALAPVLKNRGGIWIGWSGGTQDTVLSSLLGDASKMSGYDLHPVPLAQEEIRGYYYGFSNEIIWPLFHDLQTRCNFRPWYWYTYLHVNRKFADIICRTIRPDDFIWIHDYHLFHCALFLRELGTRNRIGFFLHIPFPPVDIFLKLPWRKQIINALLQYDLIGFQTRRDRRHFLDCVHRFFPD